MPPAKATKTERTHEENQERAYIAASRRGDRSIEARIESARRASEIHKRRTGRSLKVTEQDVINEEMYEEEDDGLPARYRRLTAHLQTSSLDFNKKLSAYLTNHVAMRSAAEQAIHSSYAQQHPGVPQQHTYNPTFQPPIVAHQYQQQQQQMRHPSQSPSNYRQTPYPTPRPQQNTLSGQYSQHQPASISSTEGLPTLSKSSPVTSESHNQPMPLQSVPARAPSQVESPIPFSSSTTRLKTYPSFPTGSFATLLPKTQVSTPPDDICIYGQCNLSPVNTAQPPESEKLFSTLDFNDPLTSMMMGGSDSSGTYYNFYTPLPNNTEIGKHQSYPSWVGFTSPIAPSDYGLMTQSLEDFGQNYTVFDGAFKGQALGCTPGATAENWNNLVDWGACNPSPF
ncbi:uncharacterized protein BP5553_08976 [Venustampulla echinocandica]|uniref:Uncharacterized protein n=1 Tax=Venustampulla echinocandica TaxID=2656787 RepID=A0A370TDH2_9HELO|nr:uncharacterized protein BP5553_08976 [Venustampulla echinocandica]RDL32520.1 hypothetical protein BP5553_08976 [Venustampulla echinocandica]